MVIAFLCQDCANKLPCRLPRRLRLLHIIIIARFITICTINLQKNGAVCLSKRRRQVIGVISIVLARDYR